MDKLHSIAIIGSGFSGISTALHLIDLAHIPLEIYLVERQTDLCKGVAYGTTSPHHPLNVRAERMGAFTNDPGNFYTWLKTHQDVWRKLDPSFSSLNITADSYLPRKLYAAYLQDIFHQALVAAKQKNIRCTILHDEAIDARLTEEKQIEVFFSKRAPLCVDDLVLATGIPTNQKFSFENPELLANPCYIPDIWGPAAESRLKDLCEGKYGEAKKVVIIGSGLTAMDALATLYSLNYQGTLHLISKNGALPQPHSKDLLPFIPHFKIEEIPKTTSGLFKLFKSHLKQSKTAGLDWRQLIDALRPYTQTIWQSLPVPAKKQFMRHVFSLWNKHRHRISSEEGSLEVVEFYKRKQTLTLSAGIIDHVLSLPNGKLKVVYQSKGTRVSNQLEADCVINCSGPTYQIAYHSDPLIQNLLQKQLIVPDEMGLGLKLIQKEMLAGKGEGRIYALGALLFGERFETTAVPEIRQQAYSIAETILSNNTSDKSKP